MDLLVEGGRGTNRAEALPLPMLCVCVPESRDATTTGHLVCDSSVTTTTTMLGTIKFLDREGREDGLKENVTVLGKVPIPCIANTDVVSEEIASLEKYEVWGGV